MRAGLVDASGRIVEIKLAPTPASPNAVLGGLIELLDDLIAGSESPIGGIGIGAAGLVDVRAGVVRYAPNLSYREAPIVEVLSEEFGVRVTLDNDATCAGYAEFRDGSGRGADNVIMVTLGTGIGGGFIFDGLIYRGSHGFAAEIGHMVIDPRGPKCGCGQFGCWERLASGTALGEMAREIAASPEGARILAAANGQLANVKGESVSQAAADGDPVARGLIERLGRNLGVGLASLGNILDPHRFVIGGGLVRLGEDLLVPARAELIDKIEGAGHRPEIEVVAAALGDDAGVIGAALMASSAV